MCTQSGRRNVCS